LLGYLRCVILSSNITFSWSISLAIRRSHPPDVAQQDSNPSLGPTTVLSNAWSSYHRICVHDDQLFSTTGCISWSWKAREVLHHCSRSSLVYSCHWYIISISRPTLLTPA
jgi:hypothetical protein